MEGQGAEKTERRNTMLKVLLLRKKIDAAKKALEELRAKDADFEKREEEIAQSIEEAAAMEGTEEEVAEAQKAVEEEAEKFDSEKKEHEEQKAKLENDISEMEEELAKNEAEQDTATPAPAAEESRTEKKGGYTIMSRNRFFGQMTEQRRAEIFEQEDVKAYLAEVRSVIANKREITNAGLIIPEVFIGLIKENVEGYSKLYKHLNVQDINGKGRELIQGTVGEAIWTECCAALNELTLTFNDAEIDCFKVAGYYKVCNAVLEDNNVQLATKLLEALSQAIGLALDKAILYGRNSNKTQKMPLGIVSRLAQTSEPADYPATARPWVDLHTTNIKTLSAGLTGAALFKQITLASANMKSKYSKGSKVWCMNTVTHTKLMAETIVTDASGKLVSSAAGNTMPVIGGIIEILDFIPDNVIIGGYFDLYLLGERAGSKFAQSEHVFFLEDQTVFKGTARYDGQPVIAEGFIAIGLEATTPSATMNFSPDTANTVNAILVNASSVEVTAGQTYQILATTLPVAGPITYESSATTYATVDDNGLVTAKTAGSATITLTSGNATATVSITVNAA